jgi:hypothetical protein
MFVAFAGGLYWLLQPTEKYNSALRVYQPPPATVASEMRRGKPSRIAAPAARAVAEGIQEQIKPATQEKQKLKRSVNLRPPSRLARRHGRERDPLQDYANNRPSWQRSWTYRQAVDRGFIRPF